MQNKIQRHLTKLLNFFLFCFSIKQSSLFILEISVCHLKFVEMLMDILQASLFRTDYRAVLFLIISVLLSDLKHVCICIQWNGSLQIFHLQPEKYVDIRAT